MPKKRKLDDAVKLFIVGRLAQFEPPSDVVQLVVQEFGVSVTRQQVSGYDPGTKIGQRMSAHLKEHFETTRKNYLESTADVALAYRPARVRTLAAMVTEARRIRNLALAGQFLKQIAEELGDVYTNRREHSGPKGGAIPLEHSIPPNVSPKEAADAYAAAVAAATAGL